MEFRDLKRQYQVLKPQMDAAMLEVAENCNFISGKQVTELEQQLAEYVGVKHCVTCGNGTDALTLVMICLLYTSGLNRTCQSQAIFGKIKDTAFCIFRASCAQLLCCCGESTRNLFYITGRSMRCLLYTSRCV